MKKKNLLKLDLQMFAEEEVSQDAGENEVEESATSQEEETTEAEESETVEENGNDEPHEQTAEENAIYAAMRRRAEADAERKANAKIDALNRRFAALCQGASNPITGQPVTDVFQYADALEYQQQNEAKQQLQEKGVDPALINRMIASNPVVMQAQQVIEQNNAMKAQYALQNDLAEIYRLDPSIKNPQDLANLPNFPEILERVERGESLVDAYKIANFGKTNDAARQQAINQMRGKSHLASQPNGVATEYDDVEVPAEIMSRWKAEGKTEKQIRELFSKVAKQLNLN